MGGEGAQSLGVVGGITTGSGTTPTGDPTLPPRSFRPPSSLWARGKVLPLAGVLHGTMYGLDTAVPAFEG